MAEPFDDFDIEAEVDFPITNFDEFDEDDLAAVAVTVQPIQLAIQLPDQIKSFLVNLHQHLKDANVFELSNYYESKFNQLTDKYYSKVRWPAWEDISGLFANGEMLPIFPVLYKELYYRHIYAKLQPTLDERLASFQNYHDLFEMLLSQPIQLDLPNQWIWDILDEFIYQYQSYSQWRNKLKFKTEGELSTLRENAQVWNTVYMIDTLQQLIDKSQINQQLLNQDVSGNEYSQLTLYKMLGYFSLVGLLRIHCLLGDYHLALKSIESIELHKKGLYARVTACHVSTFYYVGFAYMMMRRIPDAIKSFSHILLFISRTKQYHTRSYQFEVINKKADQMYALLAMCVAVCPTRVDENIHNIMREKHGDHLLRMQRGEDGPNTFEELFLYACPKFISPVAPNYSAPVTSEPTKVQLKVFLAQIKNQLLVPTLRSYLKLYTTLDVQKLASLYEVTDLDSIRDQLLQYKHETRQKKWVSGPLLDGEWQGTMADLDFYLKDDVIHITESKGVRRIGEWFVRNSERLYQQL